MRTHERFRTPLRGVLWALVAAGVLVAGCAGTAPGAATPAAATPIPAANVAAVATSSPSAKPAPSPTAAIVLVTPVPGAADSNVVDDVISFHVAWTPNALTAPAGKAWHVSVDAQDPLGIHNFTVISGPAVEQRIFQSPNFGFGVHKFDIPGLPAGTYTFICTLHADVMRGTIVVS